jgi:hypothetical protein
MDEQKEFQNCPPAPTSIEIEREKLADFQRRMREGLLQRLEAAEKKAD